MEKRALLTLKVTTRLYYHLKKLARETELEISLTSAVSRTDVSVNYVQITFFKTNASLLLN